MLRHVGSPSVSGSVYVTQSTILRSPVLVTLTTGLSRWTPRSRMPIVVPRPSQVGWASTNCAAPVSFVGRYGLTRGVSAPGGGCGDGFCEPVGGGAPGGVTVAALVGWDPPSPGPGAGLFVGTRTRL